MNPSDFFRKLQAEIPNIRKDVLHKIIKIEATNQWEDNFRKEGFTDATFQPWKKRDQPDPDGKVRALLVGKGKLKRQALSPRTRGKAILFDMKLPYAKIHNEGGEITQSPTFKQRMFFSHMSDRAFAAGNTASGNKWAAMSRASVLHIKIPERKYIGDSIALIKRINIKTTKYLTDKLNNL